MTPTNEELRKFFSGIPKEVIIRENEKAIEINKQDFANFKQAIKAKKCPMCSKHLSFVRADSPCMHWLLIPKGVDKKKLKTLFNSKMFGFFQIQSFLKWIANVEAPLFNINNLEEDRSEGRLYETTIKYKAIEWTLNYSEGDVKGHGGKHSSFPHYHMAIRRDSKPYLNFREIHIPFTDWDLFQISASREGYMEHVEIEGAGMQEYFDNMTPEEVIEMSQNPAEGSKGNLHFQSLVTANEGETIKGEDLARIMKKSNGTGKPIASFLKELGGSSQVIITPGEDVPEILPRKHPRKKSK